MHDDLKLFLQTNMPIGKKAKKSKVELGISDARLSGTIQDELDIKCTGGDAVTEIFRGISTFCVFEIQNFLFPLRC